MGRIGITYRDVANAASHLIESQKAPTVDAIRHCLGTGSKSTILPYLRRWKIEQGEGNSPLTALSAEALLNGVKELYQQLQVRADHKLDQNQALEREKQVLQSEYTNLSRQLSKLKQENQILYDQLAEIKQLLKEWKVLT